MTSKTINPHDRFFKIVWNDKDNVKSFLTHYFPDKVLRHLDLNTLQCEKDSFIDSRLKSCYSDMLYKVLLDHPKHGKKVGLIYLLFEHKRKPERFTRFQLLKYMMRIWDNWLETHPESQNLPFILPMVVSQGDRAWPYEPHFSELFDLPDSFEPYVPDFRHLLCDLYALDDKAIRGRIFLKVSMLLLKHINDPALEARLPEIFNLLGRIKRASRLIDILEAVLTYISSAATDIEEQSLKQALNHAFDEGDNFMATLAEKWMNQGIEKGIEKGREEVFENEKQLLLRQIRRRYNEETAFKAQPIILELNTQQMIDTIGDWVIDFATSDEFLKKLETI